MSLLFAKETYLIRGACFKVWKEFRGAFKEKIVENALVIELEKQGLELLRQAPLKIFYEGKLVGRYIPDMIVNGRVLVELKAKPFLALPDERQFWQYLKGSGYRLGLLINFGNKLEIERRIYDQARKKTPRQSEKESA